MWEPSGVIPSTSPLNDALDALADKFGENPPADDVYETFHSWVESTGKGLYPHQDEALLAALDDNGLPFSFFMEDIQRGDKCGEDRNI